MLPERGVDKMFSDERYHLLSLCGMVNTHSAAGRMVLMNLANHNQFEREMLSERTRDALQHGAARRLLPKLGARAGSRLSPLPGPLCWAQPPCASQLRPDRSERRCSPVPAPMPSAPRATAMIPT